MKSKTVPMREIHDEPLVPQAGKPLPAEIVLPKLDVKPEDAKLGERRFDNSAGDGRDESYDVHGDGSEMASLYTLAGYFCCRERQLKESMERERGLERRNKYLYEQQDSDTRVLNAVKDQRDVAEFRVAELEQAVRELATILPYCVYDTANARFKNREQFDSTLSIALDSPIVKEILERKA